VALPAGRLGRLLGLLLVPAIALAVLGILQFHGVLHAPVGGMHGAAARFSVISRAGNPGDLGAFLVLPCLVAQWLLARAPRRRGWLLAALAICAYGVAITQTVAALSALLVGSLVLWGAVLGRGVAAGQRARIAGAVVALGLVAALAAAVVPALRQRVADKLAAARHGDWNDVLTGRVDGWRAALWMLGQHPWSGVGQGAFRAEFAPAKLALLDRGARPFYSGQQQSFVNAHDEALEVGADLGWPGLVALAWALWVLVAAVRAGNACDARDASGGGDAGVERPGPAAGQTPAERAVRADAALAMAGTAALGVLSLVDFPFRIALVAFPALLLLAWVLARAGAAVAAEGAA
jgi:O-antigen ligase